MAENNNPYASPAAVDSAAVLSTAGESSETVRRRPELLALFPLGGVVGTLLGVVTNAVNGLVSPEYFSLVMGWSMKFTALVWWRAVKQGAFEGAVCGLLLGLLLTAVIAGRSAMHCPFRRGVKRLLGVAAAAAALWVAGGCCGAAWAAINPQAYRNTFPVVWNAEGVVRFAWVGGSIWGIQFGGAAAAVIACIRFCWCWRHPPT